MAWLNDGRIAILTLGIVLLLAIASCATRDGLSETDDQDKRSHMAPEPSPELISGPVFDVVADTQVGDEPLVGIEVALDDDYLDRFAGSAISQIHDVVDAANDLLVPINVQLKVDSMSVWQSSQTDHEMSGLLTSATNQVRRVPGQLLVVVTCQDSVRFDGLARRSDGSLIMQFHHDDTAKNATLLVHEFAHLLGISDHEEDPDCDGPGCLMDGTGYRHAQSWCDHHLEVARRSLAA